MTTPLPLRRHRSAIRSAQKMDDDAFAAWNRSMREQAIAYLESQGIDSPRVGDWPAFEVAPKFGIWCVESKQQRGKIGWWVFAGDCPMDYVSEDGQCHPRAALTNLVKRWKNCVPHMKEGNQPPEVNFGDGSNLKSRNLNKHNDWINHITKLARKSGVMDYDSLRA